MQRREIKPARRKLELDDIPSGVLAGAGGSILGSHDTYFLGTVGDEEVYYFEPPPSPVPLCTGWPMFLFHNPKTFTYRYAKPYSEPGDDMDLAFELLRALQPAEDCEEEDEWDAKDGWDGWVEKPQ